MTPLLHLILSPQQNVSHFAKLRQKEQGILFAQHMCMRFLNRSRLDTRDFLP